MKSETTKKKKNNNNNEGQNTNKKKSNFLSTLSLAVLLFCISYYYSKEKLIHKPLKQSCDIGSWSIENLNFTKVPKYEWVEDVTFTKKIALAREPVILTSTSIKQWKAIEKWKNFTYLKEELGYLNNAMIADDCMICPSNPKSKLYDAGLKLKSNFKEVNMSAEEFFKKFDNPYEDKYYYWYGKVPNNLRKDVAPNHFIWIDSKDEKAFGLYIWLSESHLGPYIHYDQDHNFFVQVVGTKRFILFPPWEHDNLYPYPWIHPFGHKSQVHFDHPDIENLPNYKNVQGRIAELNPGDVLYVPPYWWHHVRSHEKSVSLASWSESGIYSRMNYGDGLYNRNLQIDKLEKGSKEYKSGVIYFLRSIVEKIHEDSDHFIYNMWKIRWSHLEPELTRELSENEIKDLCKDTDQFNDSFDELFKEDVNHAVEILSTCQTSPLDRQVTIERERRDMQSIRDIELMEFMETILAEAFTPFKVPYILRYCMKDQFSL